MLENGCITCGKCFPLCTDSPYYEGDPPQSTGPDPSGFREYVEERDVIVEINYQSYYKHYRVYAYDPETEEIRRTLRPYASYEAAKGDCMDLPQEKMVEDPYQAWRVENPRHAFALDKCTDPEEYIPQIMLGTVTPEEMGLLWEIANAEEMTDV